MKNKKPAYKMTEDYPDIADWVEREVIKIKAIADVLAAVLPGDLEKSTLAALGCIISETADGIYERLRDLLFAVSGSEAEQDE